MKTNVWAMPLQAEYVEFVLKQLQPNYMIIGANSKGGQRSARQHRHEQNLHDYGWHNAAAAYKTIVRTCQTI